MVKKKQFVLKFQNLQIFGSRNNFFLENFKIEVAQCHYVCFPVTFQNYSFIFTLSAENCLENRSNEGGPTSILQVSKSWTKIQ